MKSLVVCLQSLLSVAYACPVLRKISLAASDLVVVIKNIVLTLSESETENS